MSKPKQNASAPFETTDAEAAYQHFAPLVATIPEADVEVCKADVDIVRVNARRAVDALSSHWGHIEKALPLLAIPSLMEIPTLALALSFGANKVITPASPQEIRARQSSLRPARRLTLQTLEILAELGIVSTDRVKNIRANSGAVDEAQDAVAIVALYRENAADLKGKHPFDDAYLQKLADDGNWLLGALVPKGAVSKKEGRSEEAWTRDRLWTELNRRYDELYKAGVEVWGRRNVDDNLPKLLSREGASPTAPQAPIAPATNP
jgi:hypothetical protein